MTVVVTENCSMCRFTECVTVCPVACFHADEHMVYVDPLECVDCMACVVSCPVKAIHPLESLPPEYGHWVEINRERSQALPVVDTRQAPLPSAQTKRARLGL
jgi:ferredoxin